MEKGKAFGLAIDWIRMERELDKAQLNEIQQFIHKDIKEEIVEMSEDLHAVYISTATMGYKIVTDNEFLTFHYRKHGKEDWRDI